MASRTRILATRLAVGALVLGALGVGHPLMAQDPTTPTLSAITVQDADGKATVVLTTTTTAVPNNYMDTNGLAIHLELVGAASDASLAASTAGNGKVVKVDQVDGGGSVNVTITLAEPAGDYQVRNDAGKVSVVVSFAPTSYSDPLTASAAPAAAPAAPGDGKLVNQSNRGSTSGAVSGPTTELGTTALASLDFENLANTSRVVIGTSGSIDYTTSQPENNLIVVDLPGATLPSSLTRVLDTSEFISPVRMVRAYKTSTGVRVAISLSRPTTWEARPGPDNLIYLDVAVPADMQQERTLAQQGAVQVAPSQSEGSNDLLIDEKGRTTNANQQWGAGEGSYGAGMEGTAYGFMVDSGGDASVNFTGRHINIDLVDADIHSVFRLISHVSGLNIVAGDDVKGTVTVRLEDVPWDQAFVAILSSKGLGAQRYGNIVRVAPIETIKAEKQAQLETKRSQDDLIPLKILVISLNYATASDVMSQVEGLLSTRGSVQVDSRSNQLIIKETEDTLASIRELIQALDKATPQVLIEARVVEANAQYEKALGIEWGGALDASPSTGYGTGLFFPSSVGVSGGMTQGTQSSELFFAPDTDNLAVDLGVASLGSLAFSLGSIPGLVDIDARLSAMESDGYGEIISSPHVLTLDNVQATIEQGARIPFLSTSAGGTNVQFVEASLSLKVTPHITSDDKIFMRLEVTNNRPDFSNTAQGQPAIQIKEVSTSLLVANGDTMVIGGVFATEQTEQTDRIPFFGRIPVLGVLFRNHTTQETRNEMLVFVTPRIITRAK